MKVPERSQKSQNIPKIPKIPKIPENSSVISIPNLLKYY
jgi:hypothetical protein